MYERPVVNLTITLWGGEPSLTLEFPHHSCRLPRRYPIAPTGPTSKDTRVRLKVSWLRSTGGPEEAAMQPIAESAGSCFHSTRGKCSIVRLMLSNIDEALMFA